MSNFSEANLSTMALPMPLVPPVTTAILLIEIILSLGQVKCFHEGIRRVCNLFGHAARAEGILQNLLPACHRRVGSDWHKVHLACCFGFILSRRGDYLSK